VAADLILAAAEGQPDPAPRRSPELTPA